MLLDKGADANAESEECGSVVYVAASQGHDKIVQMLLVAGADVDVKGVRYSSVLHAALRGGHERIFKMWLNEGYSHFERLSNGLCRLYDHDRWNYLRLHSHQLEPPIDESVVRYIREKLLDKTCRDSKE
jgi:ankyrin repeat protein